MSKRKLFVTAAPAGDRIQLMKNRIAKSGAKRA